MSEIISGVFGPPTCKHCHHQLKRRETCGFFDAIDMTIARICNPAMRSQFACKGKVKNPQIALWKEDCQKIDQKNKKIRMQNRITGLFGKQKPEIPKPPMPPRMIPCPNHYSKTALGKYNERVMRKSRRIFYDNAGNAYYG